MSAPSAVASMDPGKAKRLALLSTGAAAGLAVVSGLVQSRERKFGKGPDQFDPARIVAGALILAVILTLMAEVAPPVAGGFALLVLVTALFVVGEPAWQALGAIVQPNK